jgi:hypothetical protein
MSLPRVCFVLTLCIAGAARAGTVTGHIDLTPAPDRPAQTTKGFLDRADNPVTPVKPVNISSHLVIVLEGDDKSVSPPQVTWELVGESFARPIIAVPVGAEVVIKNLSRTARTLTAAEDPKLVPQGPINPTGPKSLHVNEVKTYTIGDADAPHLKGKLVVVATPHVANLDEAGKFELADVPDGTYKLRIYYYFPADGKDGWLDRTDDSVTVPAKGKVDVNPKLPAGFPVKK